MNIHLPAILGFTRYQGFDPSPFWYQINRITVLWFGEFRNDQPVFFCFAEFSERAPFDQNLYRVLCATSKPAFWRPLKWVRGHGSGLDSRPQPRECCWAAALNQNSMDCLDMHMFNSVKTKQPHKLFKLYYACSSISSSLFVFPAAWTLTQLIHGRRRWRLTSLKSRRVERASQKWRLRGGWWETHEQGMVI